MNRGGQTLAETRPATEVHHRIPRRLLRAYDRACELAPPGEVWSDEDIQLWIEFELEASRYGISPNVSREELAALIEGSTVDLPREEHRGEAHAGDWPRWGRLGGLATAQRYGPAWFALLAKRRWSKAAAEDLAAYMLGAAGGGLRPTDNRRQAENTKRKKVAADAA
jgi:hypothetical protein